MTESLAGKLLIASLRITEPTFFRTVVLMCAHDENGALGIVINRPLRTELVASHLPQYDQFVDEPSCLFSGGPVETTAALAIARWKDWIITPTPNMVVGRVGLLDLSKPIEEVEAGVEEVRVFAGYAGWSGGQLESELEEESWFIVDATPEDAFTRSPDSLWRDVLRRQPGKLAMFAYAPKDPALN
ncbi:MAG: YqgE/AlgH family protein [bacterium]